MSPISSSLGEEGIEGPHQLAEAGEVARRAGHPALLVDGLVGREEHDETRGRRRGLGAGEVAQEGQGARAQAHPSEDRSLGIERPRRARCQQPEGHEAQPQGGSGDETTVWHPARSYLSARRRTRGSSATTTFGDTHYDLVSPDKQQQLVSMLRG